MTVNSHTNPHLQHNDNTVRLMKTAKSTFIIIIIGPLFPCKNRTAETKSQRTLFSHSSPQLIIKVGRLFVVVFCFKSDNILIFLFIVIMAPPCKLFSQSLLYAYSLPDLQYPKIYGENFLNTFFE